MDELERRKEAEIQHKLEERLAILEQELAKANPHTAKPASNKRRGLRSRLSKTSVIVVSLTILSAAMAGTAYAIHKKYAIPSAPLPKTLIKATSFPLYYPSLTPEGYTYLQDSVSTDAGVVFYKLKNANKEILIIQQPRPNTDMNLTTAVDLKPIDTPQGKAYVGKNNASPIAILPTKETLINITGSPDVPADVINALVRSLRQAN
jgi:hypothetical protein